MGTISELNINIVEEISGYKIQVESESPVKLNSKACSIVVEGRKCRYRLITPAANYRSDFELLCQKSSAYWVLKTARTFFINTMREKGNINNPDTKTLGHTTLEDRIKQNECHEATRSASYWQRVAHVLSQGQEGDAVYGYEMCVRYSGFILKQMMSDYKELFWLTSDLYFRLSIASRASRDQFFTKTLECDPVTREVFLDRQRSMKDVSSRKNDYRRRPRKGFFVRKLPVQEKDRMDSAKISNEDTVKLSWETPVTQVEQMKAVHNDRIQRRSPNQEILGEYLPVSDYVDDLASNITRSSPIHRPHHKRSPFSVLSNTKSTCVSQSQLILSICKKQIFENQKIQDFTVHDLRFVLCKDFHEVDDEKASLLITLYTKELLEGLSHPEEENYWPFTTFYSEIFQIYQIQELDEDLLQLNWRSKDIFDQMRSVEKLAIIFQGPIYPYTIREVYAG